MTGARAVSHLGASTDSAPTTTTFELGELQATQGESEALVQGTSRSKWLRFLERYHLEVFAWWKVEILAWLLSLAGLIAIALVLQKYDGRGLSNLNLPRRLTINGIVAALSAASRACLVIPVSSVILQELWLMFADEARQLRCSSQLRDLDDYDSASRGPFGSLTLLTKWNKFR